MLLFRSNYDTVYDVRYGYNSKTILDAYDKDPEAAIWQDVWQDAKVIAFDDNEHDQSNQWKTKIYTFPPRKFSVRFTELGELAWLLKHQLMRGNFELLPDESGSDAPTHTDILSQLDENKDYELDLTVKELHKPRPADHGFYPLYWASPSKHRGHEDDGTFEHEEALATLCGLYFESQQGGSENGDPAFFVSLSREIEVKDIKTDQVFVIEMPVASSHED